MDDLKILTAGIYQIKLAPSYMARILPSDADEDTQPSEISFYWDTDPTSRTFCDCNLIRFKISSRHTSQKVHQAFVAYVPSHKAPARGPPGDRIKAWYCTCRNGTRVLGCCGHVAAIIWYLGYGIHQPQIQFPGAAIPDNVRSVR